MNTLCLNCIIKKLQVVARQLPMAMVLLTQLSDWVDSIKYSEITQKKIKQFYYDKGCKSCDVHKF